MPGVSIFLPYLFQKTNTYILENRVVRVPLDLQDLLAQEAFLGHQEILVVMALMVRYDCNK